MNPPPTSVPHLPANPAHGIFRYTKSLFLHALSHPPANTNTTSCSSSEHPVPDISLVEHLGGMVFSPCLPINPLRRIPRSLRESRQLPREEPRGELSE